MNSPIVREKVTLESIAHSITKLATKEEISKLATKEEISKLATKEEISKLATKEEISKLATKEDLSKFATKEEISKLATKEDLSKFATKEEISKLATKDEMNITIDNLAGAVKRGFDEVHEKFVNINEHLAKIDLKIDRMDSRFTNQLDYFHLWYPTKQEFTDLDNRMSKVEKKLKIKA